MDCITFFFGISIIFMGIAWIVNSRREKILDEKISIALKNNNFSEYNELIKQRYGNKNRYSNNNYESDLDYFEAIFILDAAEQGIFFPNGHRVFERLGNNNIVNSDNYDDYDEEYYDGDYADYEEDLEHSDHWGLG